MIGLCLVSCALTLGGGDVRDLPRITAPEQIALAADAAAGRLAAGEPGGFELQLACRDLVLTPSARREALRRVRPETRRFLSGCIDAGLQLRSLTAPEARLPRWRIVTPPRAAALRGLLVRAQSGVGWSYLGAIMLVETRMGRIRGASSAGARGPMQFLPATWRRYGRGSIESYPDSIRAAASLLRANGAPLQMTRALFAYNHDLRYVRAVQTYARLMRSHAWAFAAFRDWQVLYRLRSGSVQLVEGYDRSG